MTTPFIYPIGTPGQPWGDTEKAQWLAQQTVKRSYQDEVVSRLNAGTPGLSMVQYGELDYDDGVYPLYLLKSDSWDATRPTFLVTGGVHGYETSGVQGAIRFAQKYAEAYTRHVNVLIAPCISPWGYETINRWDPLAIDPNRSFVSDSPAPESSQVMAAIAPYMDGIVCHIDLHETTDSDNSEFRPALAARDGTVNHNWNIPDGFYLVGDTPNPQPEFQRAMIESVAQVTHIAPPDDEGKIIGAPLEQEGVINYDMKKLGLCGGMTNANYVTTTEVYPDSPNATDEICIEAQVAAIRGGFDFVIATEKL